MSSCLTVPVCSMLSGGIIAVHCHAQASHRAVKAIGRGAAADTWLFMDKKRNRLVAVKLFERPIPDVLKESTIREITVRADHQTLAHPCKSLRGSSGTHTSIYSYRLHVKSGDNAASSEYEETRPASSVACANKQDIAAQAVMPRSQLLLWQCCRCRQSWARGTSIS